MKLGELDNRVLEHYFAYKDKTAAYNHVYKRRGKAFNEKFWRRQIIKQCIEEFEKGVGKKALQIMEDQGITKGYIQSKLKLLVEFNIRKFLVIKEGVPFYNFKDASDDDWYCLTEMTANEVLSFISTEDMLIPVNAVKIKPNCKIKAMELLGKTEGLYTDKTENTDAVQIVFADEYDFEDTDN